MSVSSAEDPALSLARRLRALRKQGWPGLRITQEQLAQALGVSVPLISSWERPRDPVIPPLQRLEAYATFFATPRSVEQIPYGLIDDPTDEELLKRDELLRELSGLRDKATGDAAPDSPFADDLWRFTPDQDITIVCSELPSERLKKLPHTSPEDPDYVELYRYSDLDALLELFGHVRVVNPNSNVHIRGASSLETDEYTSHLVLLGGVDWNEVTRDMLSRVELPVRQSDRPEVSATGGFEVTVNGKQRRFVPRLRKSGGTEVLIEDVAHFYRAPNPFNAKRTVTICNGMYLRGTLGAVRTLTDARFRDRNTDYVRTRFAGQEEFSIISRVLVVKGKVVTPDWTNPDFRLHEWPVPTT